MKNLSLCTVCLLLLTLLLGRVNPLAAQADFSNWVLTTDCCPKEKNRIDSIMNKAPFVFEGRMIKRSIGGTYVTYLFEIEKIYRGGERLQAGTVEIISKMPDDSSDPSPAGFGYSRYIIFAKEINSITVHRYENIDKYGRVGNVNVFNIDTLGIFEANNSFKLEVFYHDFFHVTSYIREMDNYYSSRLALNFETRGEVMDFLSDYGLSPTDMPKADTLKNLSRREIEDIKKRKEKRANEKLVPYVSPQKMDSIVREMKRRQGLDTVQNKKTGKTQKSGNESLYMILGNVKNTIDSVRRYLEFDIEKCTFAKYNILNIKKEIL